MRILAFFSIVLAGIALTVGCDWSSGGGVEAWNSRWNWVNFSGVYRGIDGGVLVTDFTATPGTPGSTNDTTETVDTTDGVSSTFSGTLTSKPVVPGSVTITAGGVAFTDDGAGSLVGGSGGAIDYGTGAWSISLGFAPPPGESVVASYSFTISGTEGTGAPGSGASGVTIRSFTVHQEGEVLSITDNNGATFAGRMGSVRGSGGITRSDGGEAIVPVGDTIIAQFQANGVSASGLAVELVGTFQGVVGGSGAGSFFLTGRQMFGTWIEAGGRTGDINGQAAPLPITIPEGGGTAAPETT